MKKLFFLISLSLFGCIQQNEIANLEIKNHNFSIKDQQSEVLKNDVLLITNQEKNNTRILYYYVDPITMSQNASTVSGKFYWQDGCLYLLNLDKNQNIIKKTMMFPEYPKHEVSWDEEKKILTLVNRDEPPKVFEFKLGDYIRTNGRTTNSIPENLTLDSKDDEQCLSKDGIAFVGTIDIEQIKHSKHKTQNSD